MAFTLYSLLQAVLLIVNAVAVLHEERFLRHVGWGSDQQGIGGFGEEPGIKAQLMNLIQSVRTVMRGTVTIFYLNITVCKVLFLCFNEVTAVFW
uniref:Immediate early response 3-interacting protein 1 n=1 Tax=Falco tinnunculus TaxID=100819 RepID=A0A8C4UN60_FALTI